MPRKLLKKKKKRANWTLPMCIAHAQFCHFTIKLTSPGFFSILERQILCELAWKIFGPTRKIFSLDIGLYIYIYIDMCHCVCVLQIDFF